MNAVTTNTLNQNPIEIKELIYDKLTKQEILILKSAIQDLSNKEIASKLCISESTVKVHKRSICKKFSIVGQVAFRKFLRWTGKQL